MVVPYNASICAQQSDIPGFFLCSSFQCQELIAYLLHTVFVCGIILAVFTAYGIGANDIGNAFGTSVGAKAITLWQAVLIGSVMEFTGALLMGAGVTSTISKGIANVDYYTDDPDVLMYGMLCVLLATGMWLLLATYWELPVSTTHSVVGAVIGMSMVAAGVDSVNWLTVKNTSGTFPIDGVVGIVLSWVLSPILSALLAMAIFFVVRAGVLRRKTSYKLSLMLFPIFILVTIFIMTWFIIRKGGAAFGWDQIPETEALWIAAATAGGCALVATVAGIPLIHKMATKDFEKSHAPPAKAASVGEMEEGEAGPSSSNHTPSMLASMRKSKVWRAVSHGVNQDIHDVVKTDEKIGAMHAAAEVFDTKTEFSFKYLQVFTASVNSFAHGSNDVANSVGPLATIYAIWSTSEVPGNKSEVPKWILAVGGVGIVLGLSTYGYKIMRAIGVKMTKLTNSRGFIVEISAAFIVLIGSRFALPLSTTHCMVGAVAGIGILERAKGFNWLLLAKFFGGWIATLLVAGLTAAAFTAQGIYAPNRLMSERYYNQTYLTPAAPPAPTP